MTRATLYDHMRPTDSCYKQLLAIGMRRTGSREVAEELVQDVAFAMDSKTDEELEEIRNSFTYYVGVLNYKANNWFKKDFKEKKEFKEFCRQQLPATRKNGEPVCQESEDSTNLHAGEKAQGINIPCEIAQLHLDGCVSLPEEASGNVLDICSFEFLKAFVQSHLCKFLSDDDKSFLGVFFEVATPHNVSQRLQAVSEITGDSHNSLRGRFHRLVTGIWGTANADIVGPQSFGEKNEKRASEHGNSEDARPPPERVRATACLSWHVVGFKLTRTLSRRIAMELVLFLEPRSWSVKNLGESLINCGVVGLIVNVAPIIEYTVTVSVGTMGRVFYMSRIPVVVGYTVMMEERPTVAPALSWVESGSSQRCYSPSGCSILISTTGSDLRFWRTVTVFLAKMREMVICHFLDDGPTVNHEEATPPRNDHRSASGSQASVRTHADDLVAEVLVRLFAALASVAPSSDFKAPTLVTAAPTMATESLAKVTPTTSPAVRVTTLAKPSADTMSTSARSKKTGGLMKLAH